MRTRVMDPSAFREIKSNAMSLFVSEQGCNNEDSVARLSKNGLRPLSYQEALAHGSALTAELTGRWFYLDGQGIQKNGVYTFDDKGELVEVIGKEKVYQKVRIWPGNNPLLFYVHSDLVAQGFGWRFGLDGSISPDGIAPAVVGLKADYDATTPQNVANSIAVPEKQFNAAKEAFRKA